MLRLTHEVRNQMIAHALREVPNEACGMFSTAGGSDVVDIFHPMRNAEASPVVFALDGQEMLNLEREIDVANRLLVGVMHSHTSTSAYPSPTDVRDVARFDPFGAFHHVIVSLRQSEPAVRSFTILGNAITEVPIVIFDPEQGSADPTGTIAVAVQLIPGGTRRP